MMHWLTDTCADPPAKSPLLSVNELRPKSRRQFVLPTRRKIQRTLTCAWNFTAISLAAGGGGGRVAVRLTS